MMAIAFDNDIVRAALAAFWVIAITLYPISAMIPLLAASMTYGVRAPSTSPVTRFPLLSHFTVPNRANWIFMYSVGLLSCLAASALTFPLTPPALGLLAAQTARRLFECLYTHRFGSRRLVIALPLAASSFYVLAALTLAFDRHSAGTNRIFMPAIAGVVFAGASHAQHKAHIALAEVKPVMGKYGVARGGLFEVVCCPHYTAEIIIYLALVAVSPGPLTMLMAAFVVTNLANSALKTRQWYTDTFQPELLPAGRRAIFPYLL
jgi:hypothetical protein